MMSLMFTDNKLLFVGGKLAMALACCCDGNVTVTCSGYDFTLPQFMTVDYPNPTAGTCAECTTGRGGTRVMKLNGTVSATGTCHVPGNCCMIQYDLCYNGTEYPNDVVICSGSPGITGWIIHFAIPIDGTSNIRVTASIRTSCLGGGAILWQKDVAWTDDLTAFSDSLPFLSQDSWVGCGGVTGTNATVTA